MQDICSRVLVLCIDIKVIMVKEQPQHFLVFSKEKNVRTIFDVVICIRSELQE